MGAAHSTNNAQKRWCSSTEKRCSSAHEANARWVRRRQGAVKSGSCDAATAAAEGVQMGSGVMPGGSVPHPARGWRVCLAALPAALYRCALGAGLAADAGHFTDADAVPRGVAAVGIG